MDLIEYLAKTCYYAQEHIDDREVWSESDRLTHLACTSYTVACFLAHNTPLGKEGVDWDVLMDALVERPMRSEEEWLKGLRAMFEDFGGLLPETVTPPDPAPPKTGFDKLRRAVLALGGMECRTCGEILPEKSLRPGSPLGPQLNHLTLSGSSWCRGCLLEEDAFDRDGEHLLGVILEADTDILAEALRPWCRDVGILSRLTSTSPDALSALALNRIEKADKGIHMENPCPEVFAVMDAFPFRDGRDKVLERMRHLGGDFTKFLHVYDGEFLHYNWDPALGCYFPPPVMRSIDEWVDLLNAQRPKRDCDSHYVDLDDRNRLVWRVGTASRSLTSKEALDKWFEGHPFTPAACRAMRLANPEERLLTKPTE